MPLIPITIARSGPTGLRPKQDAHTNGRRTQVPAGSSVQFDVEAGLAGATILFVGKSPFGAQQVQYGPPPLPVTVAFDPLQPQQNVYSYRCTAKAGDQDLNSNNEGDGGEVEIIHN